MLIPSPPTSSTPDENMSADPVPIPVANTNLGTSSLSSDVSSLPVWDRFAIWASENKAVVYTIAGVAVVISGAGVAYYLSDSRKSSAADEKKKPSKKERRRAKQEKEERKSPPEAKAIPEQPKDSMWLCCPFQPDMLTFSQHKLERPQSSQIHWKVYPRSMNLRSRRYQNR